jgi:ArsR family metal-binding transcriptional regulator
MKKEYLVTVIYHVKKDVGVFEAENDDEAIDKASEMMDKIKNDIESALDIGDEVEIYNYYTELV